jgi:hypothetical protein
VEQPVMNQTGEDVSAMKNLRENRIEDKSQESGMFSTDRHTKKDGKSSPCRPSGMSLKSA